MITREVTEYKLFVLYLADMRGGVDKVSPVACSPSREKLEKWIKDQEAEKPYTDKPSTDFYGNKHGYSKVYKKGSILEWFNPPLTWGGIEERWVRDYPEQSNLKPHFIPEA